MTAYTENREEKYVEIVFSRGAMTETEKAFGIWHTNEYGRHGKLAWLPKSQCEIVSVVQHTNCYGITLEKNDTITLRIKSWVFFKSELSSEYRRL